MAGVVTFANYVSEKISKIRWQPAPIHAVRKPSLFATGSWDNGDENCVSIWHIEDGPQTEESEMYSTETLYSEGEPSLVCEYHHRGDVTDMVFMNQDHLLVSSSLGSVSLFKYHPNSQMLSLIHTWDKLHYFPANLCSCTSVAMKADNTFVTVGEDGRINLLNLEHGSPTRSIDEADSCTLNAVEFLKQSEVATVNNIGQLKIWDLRQTANQPCQVFLMTGEKVPLHCIDKHPTQSHIIATGGADGTLCVWDMRQDKFPVTLLSAHSADMWELKFHPTHPDNLFSCSEDGSVWHWDHSAAATYSSAASLMVQKDSGKQGSQSLMSSLMTRTTPTTPTQSSPWLSSETSKQCLDITDLMTGNTMPVNTLDIVDTTLLCGTDGGQICTVKNLVIK